MYSAGEGGGWSRAAAVRSHGVVFVGVSLWVVYFFPWQKDEVAVLSFTSLGGSVMEWRVSEVGGVTGGSGSVESGR